MDNRQHIKQALGLYPVPSNKPNLNKRQRIKRHLGTLGLIAAFAVAWVLVKFN